MHNEVWGRAEISPIVPLILQWLIDKIYRIICLSMLGTSGGALLMNYSNCLTLGNRNFCENGYCIWRKQRSSSDIFMFSNLILPQRDKKKKKRKNYLTAYFPLQVPSTSVNNFCFTVCSKFGPKYRGWSKISCSSEIWRHKKNQLGISLHLALIMAGFKAIIEVNPYMIEHFDSNTSKHGKFSDHAIYWMLLSGLATRRSVENFNAIIIVNMECENVLIKLFSLFESFIQQVKFSG